MQDDDSRSASQGVNDPAMRARLVPHVVEMKVGARRTPVFWRYDP
jgi:hypothetical protein